MKCLGKWVELEQILLREATSLRKKTLYAFSHMWIPSFNVYMYIIQGFSEWTQTTRLNRRPWKGQKGERACHVTDQGYPGVKGHSYTVWCLY